MALEMSGHTDVGQTVMSKLGKLGCRIKKRPEEKRIAWSQREGDLLCS